MASNKSISVGSTSGHLTAVAAPDKPPGQIYWWVLCRCVCGKETRLRTNAFGKQQSCGCERYAKVTRHGLSRHPLYSAWYDMHRRCKDASRPDWVNYGGRGISVCDRWRSVQAFIDDMYPTYQPGLEIDRVDTEGKYAPENCRWATSAEQNRNRRYCAQITYLGKTQTAKEWAIELGLKYGTVKARIANYGWDPLRAITTPTFSATERMAKARAAQWAEHWAKSEPTRTP